MRITPTTIALGTVLACLGADAAPWRGRPAYEAQPAPAPVEAPPASDPAIPPAPAPAPAAEPVPAPAPAPAPAPVAESIPPAPPAPAPAADAPPPAPPASAEQHDIQLINYCPSGTPVFKFDTDRDPKGSRLINGPLDSGRAWIQGGDYGCEAANGQNCGLVEFSLFNNPKFGSVNYSLQTPAGHEHTFKYGMNFHFTHATRKGGDICLQHETGAPGWCTGNTYEQCPGGFLGAATEVGTPVSCQGDNVGLTIVFCPELAR